MGQDPPSVPQPGMPTKAVAIDRAAAEVLTPNGLTVALTPENQVIPLIRSRTALEISGDCRMAAARLRGNGQVSSSPVASHHEDLRQATVASDVWTSDGLRADYVGSRRSVVGGRRGGRIAANLPGRPALQAGISDNPLKQPLLHAQHSGKQGHHR